MTRYGRLLPGVALLADVIASVVLYPNLPATVPVHWNLLGQPNGYGSRLQLVLGGPLLVAAIWLLLVWLSRLDPRRVRGPAVEAGEHSHDDQDGSYWTVIQTVVALLAVLHVAVLLVAAGLLQGINRIAALCLALLLILPGNFIGRVRPNWFVGVRTPWTLASDTVWRRTHRLAARMMVGGGLVLLPLALLLPPAGALVAALVIFGVAVLGPTVWSYFAWRQEQRARLSGDSRGNRPG